MRPAQGFLLLAVLILCGCTRESAAPQASVLAGGSWPGGHYLLQPDNSLRVLVGWKEMEIGTDAQQGLSLDYGQRPQQLPNMEILADRELFIPKEGWLATCRRDGYLEAWPDSFPADGFMGFAEQGADPGIWTDTQYPVADTCAGTDELLLTTARGQQLRAVDYEGRERWSFMLGAPARLLFDTGSSTALAASDDGFLYAVDMQGELRWKQESADHLAALLDGRLLCTARDGGLLCLDMDGQELWRSSASGIEQLRSGAELFWILDKGQLRVLDSAGKAIAVSAPDGQMLLEDLLPGPDGGMFLRCFDPEGTSVHDCLHSYGADGRLHWQYQQLRQDQSILPAHNGNCWLLELDPFKLNQPDSLEYVGLNVASQSS